MIPSARPQFWSLFSSDVGFVFRYFGKWGRKDVWTEICAKIMITIGRFCGAAEWINNVPSAHCYAVTFSNFNVSTFLRDREECRMASGYTENAYEEDGQST